MAKFFIGATRSRGSGSDAAIVTCHGDTCHICTVQVVVNGIIIFKSQSDVIWKCCGGHGDVICKLIIIIVISLNKLLGALSQTWTTHARRSGSNVTIWTPFYQTFDLITVGVVALVRLGTTLSNRYGGKLSCGTKLWYTCDVITLLVWTHVWIWTTLSSGDRCQVSIGTESLRTVHLCTLDHVVKAVESIWTALTHWHRCYRTILASINLASDCVTVVSWTQEGTWTTSSLWCWRNISIWTEFSQTTNG